MTAKGAATSVRQAYDLLVQGFGEGSQATLIVVVNGSNAASVATTAKTTVARIGTLRDVTSVATAIPAVDGTAALITVVPGSGPTDAATSRLVRDIRAATADTNGADVLVTGQTALNIDVSTALNNALPVYLVVIVVLALILLLMLFRSLTVPLMATVGFLLSLGASLGAVVAIYQWGWLAGVFGVAQPGPLLGFMPVLIVGILFGLAMDYQMFLVSAIHEGHAHGHAPKQAVLAGFRQSAPVVAAAAMIMSGVFIGFALSGDATIGSIGTALTVGVLIDALVVRMMQRIVPKVDAEGRGLAETIALEQATAPDRTHSGEVGSQSGAHPEDAVPQP